MKRIPSSGAPGRVPASVAACAMMAALLLSACASDPGEEVVDAPFPDLAEVPSRPQAKTTPEERKALRTQLERRRDEINRAAASLLRGGTEPVPVSLDSQLPDAPSEAGMPPPPLPNGLPPSPERPASVPDENGVPEEKGESGKPASSPRGEEDKIEAPREADMPPPKAAAGEKDGQTGDDVEPQGDAPEEEDGGGS